MQEKLEIFLPKIFHRVSQRMSTAKVPKNIFTPDFGAFDETGQGFSCGCPNSIVEVEFQHWDHQFYL